MGFAQRLKALRAERQMSLTALADASGVTRQTIYALEHGRNNPQLATVQLLARGLATDKQGRVSAELYSKFLDDLWKSAELAGPVVAEPERVIDLDKVLADYPEARAELAFLLRDDRESPDARFVLDFLKRSRQLRLEREQAR